jgi:hypothetical protein
MSETLMVAVGIALGLLWSINSKLSEIITILEGAAK